MRPKHVTNAFELEALEPRLLLSVECSYAQAPAPDPLDVFTATEVSIEQNVPQSALAEEQSSEAEEGDGFDGFDDVAVLAPAVSEGSQSESSDAGSEAVNESEEAALAVPVSAAGSSANVAPTPQVEVSSLTVEQLIETLKAANGPPFGAGLNLHLTPDRVLDLAGEMLDLQSDEILSGSGTILGGVAGSGIFRPGNSPGHITVSTFAPGAEALTEIEIQGLGQGTTYDWIEVTGAATFDGTLKIIFSPGGSYVPALGNTFNVITYGSHTGEFANWLGTASIAGHPDWALKPTYNANSLSLTIVQTPTLAVGVDSAILSGLDTLSDVGDFLDGFGELAESIPFIGSNLGTLADSGTAITNGLRNRLTSLLNSLPSASLVTSTIESWNNTAFGGFTFLVRGVLAHYGTLSTQPMWGDVNLELVPTAVNQNLQNILGGVFGAAFSGSTPSVSVTAGIGLDMAFGNDSGFFVEVDSVEAKAAVNATGLGGYGYTFNTPVGMQSLTGSNGSVTLTASVSATPDESILTGGRITLATLGGLNGSNLGDAFNLDEAGTLDATFPLTGSLNFLGFSLTGNYAVRIQSDDLMSGDAPDVSLDVNSTLTVMGQTLSGSFTLKNTGTETIIEASNVNFQLGTGGSRVLSVQNGSGTFVLLGTDLAGMLTLDFNLGPAVPNIGMSATGLTLALNTSAGAVSEIDGTTVNLPAGPYYRVSGNGTITLTNPQASLSGDFVFEPRDADGNPGNGYEETAVGVANLAFSFTDGTNPLLNVTDGTGAFVFRSNGIVGTVSADVSLAVSSLDLSGVFTVTLNDTASAYNQSVDVNGTTVTVNVPAGPYLRVTGVGANLTVQDIGITGSFTFERKQTTTGGERVVTVAASAVSLDLGSTANDLISVTNGSGAFIIAADGLAGTSTATVGINVSGVSLAGTFTVRINDTSVAVNETVSVGGSNVTINLPAGPYLQVKGTGVTLGFLGVSLSGNFSFEQRTSLGGSQMITVMADSVSFNFGTSILSATNGHGFFVITDAGIAGQGEITVHVNAFGGGFSHTFGWGFNTTAGAIDQEFDWEGTPMGVDLPAGPFNKIDSGTTPVSISVPIGTYTQSITGRFILTLVDGSPDYVTVAASSVSATIGSGTVGLAVSGGSGAMVIYDSGLAGEVKVTTASLSGAGVLNITAMNLKLRLNNTGADVGNPTAVVVPINDNPADNVSIQFIGPYYHNYLAVSGTAEITGLVGAVTLGGNFVIEKARIDTNNDSVLEDVFKLGVTDLHFALKAGTFTVASFHNGSGALILKSTGLAAEADLEFDSGTVGLSGTLTLKVNTTGAAVTNASVTTPGGTQILNLTTGNYVQVNVDGHLHVGSFALPFQLIVKVSGSSVEFRRLSDNELLVSVSNTGAITLGTPLSSLTNFDFAQAGPFEWVMFLQQLGQWFDSFRESSLFNVDIPFTGGVSLGEAMDWTQVFLDTIYKHMVSTELQSRTMFDTTLNEGTLSGAILKVQLGDEPVKTLTITDAIPNTNERTGTELVQLLNNAITAQALSARLVARINKDDQVVIALTENEIAEGTTLNLMDADAKMAELGFGPGDGDETTSDQIGILTERYSTEDFFVVLADILNDGVVNGNGGVTYNPAQQVYTYNVNKTLTYDTQDLFGETSIPFDFDLDLGPIADASLTGALQFSVQVGFNFTLGFDLGAAEVPRILSSSLVPVPANGRLSADAHFGVYLNDALPNPLGTFNQLFPLTLAAANTTTNNSIDDLATDLNNVLAATAYGSGTLADVLIAQKAGGAVAISAKSDQLGIINRITIISPKNDTFATEMGIGSGVEDLDGNDATTQDQIFVSISTSPKKGLFLDDAQLTGSVSVTTTAAGIDGTLRFGFVEISTTDGAFGTLAYDGTTTAPITAAVRLEDQTTGETRFYITDLMNGTSSNNISNLVPAFDFGGSFLARLDNITVGGLGFSFPLGSNPEVSVWIPDITKLTYNANPYDATTNNEGIFLTYPNLGSLQNFTSLNFTQIIKALDAIADNLSQLAAFSFLDEPLPFVNISVNDMLDYASKFAELIDGASSGGTQSSLQDTLTELEHQIEVLFNLDPNILTVSLDENGVSAASLVTAGGTAGTASTLTVNYNGFNNAFKITANANGTTLNGSVLRIVGDSSITGATAQASWDVQGKLLVVKINPGKTTANAIISAINGLGSPWNAALAPPDAGNTGAGTITTAALKFSFVFSTAYANSLPFQLDLQELVSNLAGDNAAIRSFLELATTLVQIQGSGTLTVSASATLTLDFGLDVTNPGSIKPFFYDSTGVELLAKVLGTNISLEASLGSVFGIWITDGKVTVDQDGDPETDAGDGDRGAEFRLGLKDNNGDARHYFDESWFDSNSIDLHLEGGVSAQLPIFAPFETTPLSGNADDNGDGYPDNYLVVEIPDLVRLFIDEAVSTSATGTEKIVKFAGLNNDLLIKSDGTYTNYSIVFLDTLSGDSANASFNVSTNTLTVNIAAGETTANTARNAIKAASGASGHFNANTALTADDDGDPDTTTNDGTGKLEKLSLITPDFSSLFDGLELCDVIANSIDEILDGLDTLLGWIEDGLNEIVYNTDLPLIGNGLQGAANFIGDFRDGLLKELREEVEAAGGNGLTAVENAIKKALWNSLGPGGLDLLVDFDTGEALDNAAGYSQLDVVLDCDTGLVVNVRLAKSIALLDTTQNPIDFEIGVPGFGLAVDGNVVLSLGFDFKFGFGVDMENGFYFNTAAPASDPELSIYFRAEIPGLHAAGELLFLQLDVTDDADSPSFFEGAFEVDLKDPNHDGKLTTAELFSSGTQFDDILHAVLGAEADVNLDLAASFGGNTAFPRVLAKFHLGWRFDTDNGAGDPEIAFTDIYLDLGTFISDFLGPILSEIRKVTEPLQPIIDVVTARIPVISDLAGETITLLDLAEVFGLLEPSTVDFIEGVIQVIELINDLEGLGEGTILIPFGSFSLLDNGNGERTNIQALQEAASRTMDDIAAAAAASTGPGASSTYTSAASGFVSDAGSLSNFSIPIFDNPAELFNLFIGEPVRLVEWRMPTFKFKFTYTQKIPIYPPLYAQFGGTIGADINIGFGYDTYGIQKYISSEDKNWVDILDGFYVLDFDANGNEQPELRLYGELFAGASINLLIVEAGVRGGVGFEVTFDLNDVNDDGKVRVSEIVANAQQDPRCIFDIEGRIYLFLEAFLKIDLFFFSIDKTWRFAEITLFSFEITCPEPILASNASHGEFTGGDLYLNIGSRAADREEIDTNDGAETMIVKHTGGSAGAETVEVQWGNWKQTFDNVSKVVIEDAGQGDDYVDLRGVLSASEVHGGQGNDTIFLSDSSDSKAYGDDGNDTITASSVEGLTNVELHGGAGNDTLTAGPSGITIYGDGGNDSITGSPEADFLYGDDGTGTITDGADTITGLEGADTIRGGKGNDIVDGGADDDWIRGDDGNDTIRGSRGNDIVEGGEGDDKLYGSSGNDLLVGGGGSDWANGHGGVDLLIGEYFTTINNLSLTAANLDAIRNAVGDIPNVGITMEGLTGGDVSNPNPITGNDLLIGGGGVDVLFGGPGDDFLYGGNFLNNGETEPIEDDDNDFFDGGPGNDTIFGDDAMGKVGDRDTGIYIQSSIFFDLNKNGVKDADEVGFGGVTVTLYRNDGLLIGDTETDVDGSFKFTGLDPDRYYMEFGTVAGLTFIVANPWVADSGKAEVASNDSDVNASGRTMDFELTFDETEKSVTAGYEGDPLVSVSNVSVTEGNTGQTLATLTITLSGPQRTAVTLNYRTEDGNDGTYPERNAVEATGDYIGISGTLTFAAGETSKTITIAVLGDTAYEEHQQFRVILSNPSTGIKLPTSPETTVLVTIINDDPIPALSIGDYVPPSTLQPDGTRIYTVGEGSPASFIVSLSNASQYDITVWYLVDSAYDCGCDPDFATPYPLYADGDYVQPAPTMITFKAGEVFKEIKVTLRDDLSNPIDEPDESFYVDLFNPTYARVEDGRGYGTIPDDDPQVHVSIHEPGFPTSYYLTQMEGDAGYTIVTLEVTLSKISAKTVTLTYSTSPGTAVEAVYSGDAGNGPDYESTPNESTGEAAQTIVFAPGETSKLITVKIYGDPNKEDDELFFVNLISAENADIAANPLAESNHVTVEITNDDALLVEDAGPWSVYFGDLFFEVQEPDSGTAFANITIHRTAGSSQPIAVFYTTNGTATSGAGGDYGAVFRHLVYFSGNQTTQTVRVPIYSDTLSEGDETVILSLRNPTGGLVRGAPDTATLVIHDEDVPVVSVVAPSLGVFFDPVTMLFTFVRGVNEGTGAGVTTAAFAINLDKPAPPGGVFVDWTTVSGTARAGQDYTGISNTAFIAAGLTSTTINVNITRDSLPELTEKFGLRLSSPVRATLAEKNYIATCSIYDDDLYEIEGTVFYDNNGNGFLDIGEKGIEDVDVTLTWMEGGIHHTSTVQTDADGKYMENVALGQVSIAVDGSTVKSPFQKGSGPLLSWLWSGEYSTTTDNEVQAEEFDGIQGISPFGPVGYKNSFSLSLPEEADDVGRGGTDDTIFGGPGNDIIDAGAGDDHVIGGHWQTATDTNMPVNNATYDAVVVVVTDDTNLQTVYGLPVGTTLHSIYDAGPVFSVTPQTFAGTISGQIWLDKNLSNVQDLGDTLFTGGVLVTLLDCAGNPVNAVYTTTGSYSFTNLFVDTDNPSAESEYVIQFELPEGYAFAEPNSGDLNANEDLSSTDNDAEFVNRTRQVTISASAPTEIWIDAGIYESSALSAVGTYQFSRGSYSVNEATPGYVEISVTRSNSFTPGVVVIKMFDGTGANGAKSSPAASKNYTASTVVLVFDVGETLKTFQIEIFNRDMGFCDFRYFTLTLNDATGRPYDTAAVYIAGAASPTISDDDTIYGGSDWDIILGDSGNIPGYAVVAEYVDISKHEKLGDIKSFGGPGNDSIYADIGADYIDGQLGDDILEGGDGVDIVIGGLGDDQITVGQGDDDIRGDHGYDVVISTSSVAGIVLTPTKLTHQQILLGSYSTLNEHDLLDTFEAARLFGDAQANRFDLNGWTTTAFVSGGGGQDSLFVTNNVDMILRDASLLERVLFSLFFGFAKDASLSLPTGATYHLASLENVTLTGEAGDNTFDAHNYSRPVTFVGAGGNDTLIGGSASDTFVFDGDDVLGTDTITGNGGLDTLDFSHTSAAKVVDVDLAEHSSQPAVAGNVNLILVDDIENVSGGDGHDFLYGNALANVLLGGPGDDWLEGREGNETYVFDTDTAWGNETVVEDILPTGGYDILDFSGTTTQSISLNMGILGAFQKLNDNLMLRLNGEGIEEVHGGSKNDTIRGNSNNNVLRGGLGDDLLDGKSGDDVLDGGEGNDDLNGGTGGEVAGDTINETGNTNFTLTDTSLTRGTGEVDALDNIEVANLTGGAGNNTFTLTGWTGKGSLNGMGGLDLVVWAADANFTLTDASLTMSLASGPMALSGIEHAVLTGGPGDNNLNASGFSGRARLTGGMGNDTLVGGAGADLLYGGPGNDTLTGGRGNDLIDGGTGSDQLIEDLSGATWEVDFVIQNNILSITQNDPTPTPTDDTITESDTLSGIETAAITGSPQEDSFDVTGWTVGTITVNGSGATDTVKVLVPEPDLPAPAGGTITLTDTSVTFTGGAGTISLSSIEQAILTGTDRDEIFDATGFTGTAWLYGKGGNDVLRDGPGPNWLEGGDGDDVFLFTQNGQVGTDFNIVIGGNLDETDDGVDTLDLSAFSVGVTVNLSNVTTTQTVVAGELQIRFGFEDIENLIGGSGADMLAGNALNNAITGGLGADNIDGGGGTNTLIETGDANFTLTDASLARGADVDTLTNIDRAELTGGAGANTIDANGFTGTANLSGLGGDDVLIGGSGSDTLIGGAGNDTLRGGAGSDTYQFDVDEMLGTDIVDETSGLTNGSDILDFSQTTTVGVIVNLSLTSDQTVHATNLKLQLTDSTGVEHIFGGEQADVLIGNAADNIFLGGLGNDQFNGNGGTLDTVYETRDADMLLTDATLTIGSEINQLTAIQRTYLVGGDSHNILDATAYTGIAYLLGQAGNDTLYGGSGDDFLSGGDGDDVLRGNGGDDDLRGGKGNDLYVFDQSFNQGSDTLREYAGEGFADTLQGVGVSGVDVDLNSASLQVISANLSLTLAILSGVEFSF